jgi:hypothetical protein
MYCPYPKDTANLLQNSWIGDKVDLAGVVNAFSSSGSADDMSPSGTVVAHEIDLDTLTTTATKMPVPTPIAVTDDATSKFVPYSGSGWAQYEGTYIKLTPNGGGQFTAHAEMYGNTMYTPGGAVFDNNEAFLYGGKDLGVFPPDSSQWSAVGGVVELTFGGAIDPISSNDFCSTSTTTCGGF